MGEDLEAAARHVFVEKLQEILAMRRAGKFDNNGLHCWLRCLLSC